MNIYKIWQDVNNDYNTYDSAVVVAESEDDARTIHPRGVDYHYTIDDGDTTWVDIKDVKVQLIGTTHICIRVVVLASFNAG